MADNTSGSCLNESFGNTSDDHLPKRGSKKKFFGYYYVPPESDEADTLKDKFWRDLEQGKLNFLNTVDMYTRVKRPGKLSEVDCFPVSNQDPEVLSDVAVMTCLQSSMSSSSSVMVSLSARDASPPSSSGYESSSIPSIGSISATNSPTESDQHFASPCDLSTNVAVPDKSAFNRKRKMSSKCVWLSVRSKCRKCQPTERKPLYRKKKMNCKFFRYVDASSEEADTLKDRFWRDLELGNVSAITTTDLYSSVKVSRRTRQLSFSSVRNSDQAEGLPEVPVTGKEESHASETLDCTEVSAVNAKCSATDDSISNRKNDASSLLHQPNDCYISDQVVYVADCKLLSPCSVSVERLPFSVGDIDLPSAGTAEMCSKFVADNSSCTNVETAKRLITQDHHTVPKHLSMVNVDCKRWHHGRCRTGLRCLNKDMYAVECVSGSSTHIEDPVHLCSLEINRSIPVCHLPLAFPSAQQNVICGWLEDGDTLGKAGKFYSTVFCTFSSMFYAYSRQ